MDLLTYLLTNYCLLCYLYELVMVFRVTMPLLHSRENFLPKPIDLACNLLTLLSPFA